MKKIVFTKGKKVEEFSLDDPDFPAEVMIRAVEATAASHNLEAPDDLWIFEIVGDQEQGEP